MQKVGRKHIFKSAIGKTILHEISNDNGVTLENFVIQISNCQEYNDPPSQ
jgi:hypothetical protein